MGSAEQGRQEQVKRSEQGEGGKERQNMDMGQWSSRAFLCLAVLCQRADYCPLVLVTLGPVPAWLQQSSLLPGSLMSSEHREQLKGRMENQHVWNTDMVSSHTGQQTKA